MSGPTRKPDHGDDIMQTNKVSFAKTLLPILMLLYSAGSFAALNKWVDGKGKVHYSDQEPPANVKAQILRPTVTEEAPAETGAATEETTPAETMTDAEREAESRRQQLEKEAADKKAAQEKAKADARKLNCEVSQQNLRTMQSDLRLSEINAEGERVYLSDEQRRQKIEKIKQNIEEYCD
ncbi:MAG: hypothetical protein A2Z95_07220 [Gallionellales bacterium GWA2_60_18]|nr:MAG: hypothetical protein A2Z95_07220 [Gallionellales bacterium GWA2_60_18]